MAGNLCVARRRGFPSTASSSRLDLARNTYVRGLLHFHHGLWMSSQQLQNAQRHGVHIGDQQHSNPGNHQEGKDMPV